MAPLARHTFRFALRPDYGGRGAPLFLVRQSNPYGRAVGAPGRQPRPPVEPGAVFALHWPPLGRALGFAPPGWSNLGRHDGRAIQEGAGHKPAHSPRLTLGPGGALFTHRRRVDAAPGGLRGG